MKKTLFVLPLAMLLAYCSTSRTNTSGTQGTTSGNTTMTDGSMSSTNVPAMADQAEYGSTVTTNNTSQSDVAGVMTTSDAYHVNTDLTNGNVYNGYNDARAADLAMTGTGGWTYNTDMRRNTDFNNEMSGAWTLRMSPEVATAWRSDVNRPQDYASYWTPEAMSNRQTYLSASATMDRRNQSGSQTSSSSHNGSTNTNSASDMSGTNTTSGNTDAMGNTNQDMNAANNMNNNTDLSAISYSAANGNNFMLPSLNLYIENGSFTGYTGCNQVMGSLTVSGDRLRFDNSTPATAINCSGGFDQQAFLERLKRVNSYEIINNEMRLKDGNEVLMVLARK